MKWTILWQESIQRAATWASIQPEHQRVFDWVPLRGHKPAGEEENQAYKLHDMLRGHTTLALLKITRGAPNAHTIDNTNNTCVKGLIFC